MDVKKKKGEVEIPPKGIYTSVPKKGTFGMNKFTLSERQGYKGVATEYEYFHDPMPDSKKRLEALEEERKKRVTEAPFRAPGALANGYAGKNSIKVPPYVPQGEPIKPPAAEPVSDNAFKPPRVGKSGFFGAMNRYPEYQPDPEAGRIEAAKKARAEAREKLAAAGGGAAWRPSKGYKTVATPSILRMNI